MYGMSGPAAQKLKELRSRSGLSMQDMADALGMKKTTYQHYESGYKKEYFDPDMVEKFRSVLLKHGIADREVDLLGYLKVEQSRGHEPLADLKHDTDLGALFADTPYLDAECVTRAALQVLAAIKQHGVEWMPEEVAKAITENAADYTREKLETEPRVVSIGGKTIPLPRVPGWPS